MPITQLGALNTTALVVPDVYVQIVPPQTTLLNGVPTNVLGVVGTAQWGPINVPTIVGNMAQFARSFGAIQDNANDLGTASAVAVLQGASNLRCVRVTDGTDVAATATITDGDSNTPVDAVTATALYTGTLGNQITLILSEGSNSVSGSETWKLTVAIPGRVAEVFDNVGGTAGTTAGSVWANLVDAVNNGQSVLRGASEIISLAIASNPTTSAPVSGSTVVMTGGADGAGVSAANMVGTAEPRTGMYALSGSGFSVLNLSGFTDETRWSEIDSFCLAEGAYGVLSCPAGQTVAQSVATKKSASADSYALKIMHGDWVYWFDGVAGRTRLIAPANFAAGRLASLSPEQSTLNKPVYGLVGTERGEANQVYSSAELQELASAGVDVIANPSPGGEYFSCRIGHNASSNPVIHGDNYTRMTNYLASTFNAGLGLFLGRLQSAVVRRQAKNTLENFLSALELAGQIGNAEGTTPFQVTLDSTNNLPSQVALGYMRADVKVQYLSVIEKFLVNVEGGQSVTIERVTAEPAI